MANFSQKLKENIRLLNLRKHWAFFVFLTAILFFNIFWMPALVALVVSVLVLILFFLMVSNIISLARAEEIIRRERNQIFGIISRMTDGLIVYDIYFRVLLINSKAEEILSVRREDVLGKAIKPEMQQDPRFKLLVQTIFPSLAPKVKRITVQYPEVMEVSFTEPKELELQITTNPILDSSGRLTGYLKIIHDISRELAISRMKSEFITIAAHQMRTPLAAVKWTFQTLLAGEAGPLNEEQLAYVKDGAEVSTYLIKLVGDLLDVAKIEEGKFGYEFAMVDIVELIEKVLEENKLAAVQRDVNLIFTPPSVALPQIKADPQKISLALQNLISNAIKYNRKGGWVAIEVEREGNYIKTAIRDSGVGIPANEMNRLFSKFFRGSNVIRLETEGSGLGLFIVKNIIKRHGGNIWAQSEEGVGSAFYFTLPVEAKMIPETETPGDDF